MSAAVTAAVVAADAAVCTPEEAQLPAGGAIRRATKPAARRGHRESKGGGGQQPGLGPAPCYDEVGQVLIVGDGNLSFARALCERIAGGGSSGSGGGGGGSSGGASGVAMITATTLEPEHELCAKYPETSAIIARLQELGATVRHEIDATRLGETLVPQLEKQFGAAPKFARIVFQFPLAHPSQTRESFETSPDPIVQNKLLIHSFLKCATNLLAPCGEIHITSKEVKPYTWWQIHRMADGLPRLAFARRLQFDATMYPGYETRKPVNVHSDRIESFPLTGSTVFVFVRSPDDPLDRLPPKPGPFVCLVCDRDTKSAINLAAHIAGRKHKLLAAIDERWRKALADAHVTVT